MLWALPEIDTVMVDMYIVKDRTVNWNETDFKIQSFERCEKTKASGIKMCAEYVSMNTEYLHLTLILPHNSFLIEPQIKSNATIGIKHSTSQYKPWAPSLIHTVALIQNNYFTLQKTKLNMIKFYLLTFISLPKRWSSENFTVRLKPIMTAWVIKP